MNMQVFVGMVQGGAELNLFYSILKYNYLFVAPNLSGSVIAFMGDRLLEGGLWVFNLARKIHGCGWRINS